MNSDTIEELTAMIGFLEDKIEDMAVTIQILTDVIRDLENELRAANG